MLNGYFLFFQDPECTSKSNIIESIDSILPVIKQNEKKNINNKPSKLNDSFEVPYRVSKLSTLSPTSPSRSSLKRDNFMIDNKNEQSKMVVKFKLTKINDHKNRQSYLPSTPIVVPTGAQTLHQPKNMHSIKFIRNDKNNLAKIYQRLSEASD